MELKIEEIGSMYASLFYAGNPDHAKNFRANEAAAGEACDSYIASVQHDDAPYSTGNYDDGGMMDDDFSVNRSDKTEEPFSAARYSAEYAEQKMKVITKTDQADGEMNGNSR